MANDGTIGMETRIVDAGGSVLQIREAGAGDPPLLLLHGLGGDLTTWTLNQRALADGRRVIAVDLPGHGASTKDIGTATVPHLARMLEGLPKALDLDRFHLLGLSFGGAIALDLALRLGDRVQSLVCLSATGLGAEINTNFIDGYLQADTAEAMRPLLSIVFHDERLINDAMVGYALAARSDPEFRSCVDLMFTTNFRDGHQLFTYDDRIGRLTIPIHIVWGREDRIVPVAHAERLAPDLPVTILDGVGHMPNVEAAEAFNRTVLGFLRQV